VAFPHVLDLSVYRADAMSEVGRRSVRSLWTDRNFRPFGPESLVPQAGIFGLEVSSPSPARDASLTYVGLKPTQNLRFVGPESLAWTLGWTRLRTTLMPRWELARDSAGTSG
jgi:hypothetical protein